MSDTLPENDAPPSALAIHSSSATCKICSQQLNVHQAARGLVCDKPDCRQSWARQIDSQKRARHQRNNDLITRQASLAIYRLMEQKKINRYSSTNIAPVPASTAPLRPADSVRQTLFRQHFEALLDEWENREETLEFAESSSPTEAKPDPAGLAAQACSTCRGHCCREGSTHAFITLDVIARWVANNPDTDLEECRAYYLSRLPSHSIAGSCVYHGVNGCQLEREMRADLCNTWDCSSLSQLNTVASIDPKPVTLIVASENGNPLRVRIVQSDSGQLLEPEVEIES